MFSLENKVILIIGGRGYLGRDFCRILSENKAIVVSADLPDLSLAAKGDSNEVLDTFDQYDIDVTDRDSVRSVVEKVITKYDRIDSLVYSVTSKPDDFYFPYTECSLEGWKTVINSELDGLFISSQEVGKFMEEQHSGNMIFISSIYGVVANDQRLYEGSNLANIYSKSNESDKKIYSHAGYPVAKGGVISLTRYLAAYWGNLNIRVNCISPGGVYHKGENEEFVKKYSEKVPLGRKGYLKEISNTVVFLASEEASYITGQNLIVDGGFTIW